MSDILLPPHLRQARTSFRYIDAGTGMSRATFTGAARTASKGGDRLGASIEFTKHGGDSSEERANRAALRAFISKLRGRQNRAYLYDKSYRRRGSMPTGELLPNNTFTNGTTGWSCDSSYSLSASDRILRAKRVAMTGSAVPLLSGNFTVVANAPYIARAMIAQGQGAYPSGFRVNNSPSFGTYSTGFGMKSQVFVPSTTSDNMSVSDGESTGLVAGDYIQIPYVSYSRCALVDNSQNYFTQSDAFDNAAWTKARSTVTPSSVAPDGSAGADQLIEDSTASNSHYVEQVATVGSSAADYAAYAYARASTRTWMWIQIVEGASNTSCILWVNLSTGAKGATPTTGANWSNLRTFVTDMGNAWYRIHLIAKKTNSATSIRVRIGLTTGDNVTDYTGNGTSSILIWRAGLAQSSFPSDPRGTVATANTTGNTQTGSRLYTKGWPVSTDGLLLIDDQVEIITSRGSELKILTAPVNSDAAGLASVQFEPPLQGAPADGAPIILHQPMGRFIYTGESPGWDNDPGYFSSASCDLEEACGL